MLYPTNKVNYYYKQELKFLWVIQKNIEDEEKWAQKKEERVKETKENKLISGRN